MNASRLLFFLNLNLSCFTATIVRVWSAFRLCGRIGLATLVVMNHRQDSPVKATGSLLTAALALSVLAVMLFLILFHASNHPLQPLVERQPGMDRTGSGLQAEQQSPITLGKLGTGTGSLHAGFGFARS